MKSIVLSVIVIAASWSFADAKGGQRTTPIPPSYDYAREKIAGYKKDYCEDSIGNHVYCKTPMSGANGRFSATYR